jgi:hypothetical protein
MVKAELGLAQPGVSHQVTDWTLSKKSNAADNENAGLQDSYLSNACQTGVQMPDLT